MLKYLKKQKETTPTWLAEYKINDYVSFDAFCSGRIAFYPGCGTDGHLVEIGNKSQSVHTFLYTDYYVSKDMVWSTLHSKHAIKGYHILGQVEWKADDLPIAGLLSGTAKNHKFGTDDEPFCILVIFERDADYGDDWGSEKFAVAFMNIDGFAVYQKVFVNYLHKAPFLFLLEDYGYGMNYDKFGKGGILDRMMKKSNLWPQYVVCGHANLWKGYQCIPRLATSKGGMHHYHRALYTLEGEDIWSSIPTAPCA